MPAGIYKRKTLFERLWDKVLKTETCWIWQGSLKQNGYGQISENRKKLYPHRVSYIFHKGLIPENMNVCHSCDNRRCVNPQHLFLGTQADNMNDMNNKGRHARGTKTNMSKLTDIQVIEIRSKYSSGIKNAVLCKEYGVSHSTIHRVVHNKLWIHVKNA